MSHTAPEERSIGELVAKLSEQASALIRDEMRLAQLELGRKLRFAGLGAGLVGVAGLATWLGVACLVAAGVLALALVVPGWLAALLVGVGLLLVAAVCGLVAKREISEAMPPVPQEALSEVKADLRMLKR